MSKKIYIFFGPPGSGKGTQSDLLGKKIKIPVISPGELLRYEEDHETKLGKEVASKLAKGKLVSDEIIEKMLDSRLKKKDVSEGFILDGYPRREHQLELFKRRLKKLLKIYNGVIAINVDVSDREVKRRIGGRRVCSCGAAYHLRYNPPKKANVCDLCGKKIYQREDDRPNVLKERLKHYHHVMKPIVLYFKDNYILLTIDGEQKISKIEAELYNKIKKLR